MTSRFTAILEDGHKGAAVIVPFDPAKEWKVAPVPIYSPIYGKNMLGHPVRGTMAGQKFEGWIGHRWGRFFILVSDEVRRAAGLSVGDEVNVAVELAVARKRRARKSP